MSSGVSRVLLAEHGFQATAFLVGLSDPPAYR